MSLYTVIGNFNFIVIFFNFFKLQQIFVRLWLDCFVRKIVFNNKQNSNQFYYDSIFLNLKLKLSIFTALISKMFIIWFLMRDFSQICMDVHSQQTSTQQTRLPVNPNINEAICLEVVGILKRCFMQQASVKTTLYKGEAFE